VNLADQDRPLHDDHGWVSADEHERKVTGRNRHDDDEYEDITDDETHNHRHNTRRSLEDDRTSSLKNGNSETRGRRVDEGLVAEE
jgi:hypothetical protein